MNNNILTVQSTKYRDLVRRYLDIIKDGEIKNRDDAVNVLIRLARVESHFSSGWLTLMYFRFFVFKESSTDNIWSIFDHLFTKENGITIDNLYKEDDTLTKKSIVYSAQFTYYFVHGQYKKIANLFQRFNKEKNDSKYINIEAQRGTTDKNSLLLSLKTLVITLMYNKEINNSKYRNSYIYELNAASERGYIDDYLSDPAILLLHQRVMHDVFENSRSAIRDAHSRFGWRQLSILDRMESDPQFLERFLDSFNPDAWSPISSRK